MTRLTERERGIAALVADGLTDRAIAARLRISERTVEGHVLSIRNRLGLANRTQIATWHVRATARSTGSAAAAVPRPSAPNNLPAQRTSFVGRHRELTRLPPLLRSARLLTLAGPGGGGKTRLALELAAGALSRHPDGVWFLDLAPLPDAGALAEAVAAVLPSERWRALLLLDGCEHLVEACGRLVSELLRARPGVSVLCTTRRPLHTAGEVVSRVGPLSLPAPSAGAVRALDSDAVRLFIDRAALSAPGLDLNDAGVTAVAAIARRLDGLPLALELAAGYAGTVPIADLRRHVDAGFVPAGRRGLASRQRTLAATMDRSYELLAEDERRLFRRLAVLGDEFTADIAEAVCGVADAGDLLRRLVDDSLVSDAGSGRFRLFETVRAYGLDQLRAHGELDWMRVRGAQYANRRNPYFSG
ncbi:MAG TPA: LuxR C-terminal-related transcriptional regulator [Candidatus Dormibacteraeota bacterium]|nr:LuxR C-terminal-related transcriptional regulator [Candidatus Dormibacteraeota bacterium]